MKVKLLSCTTSPCEVVSIAAKTCYSSLPIDEIVSREFSPETNTAGMIEKILEMGHHSVLEHASFTFSIEGVSRTLLAQLTRHRIASFSVRSQRYVSERDFSPIVPVNIKTFKNQYAMKIFSTAVKYSQFAYDNLVKLGVDKEDARSILPNCCETQLIVTMNARSLLNFFELRCCSRAQTEIRSLAYLMLHVCKEAAPHIFKNAGPTCIRGFCREGEKSCKSIERRQG